MRLLNSILIVAVLAIQSHAASYLSAAKLPALRWYGGPDPSTVFPSDNFTGSSTVIWWRDVVTQYDGTVEKLRFFQHSTTSGAETLKMALYYGTTLVCEGETTTSGGVTAEWLEVTPTTVAFIPAGTYKLAFSFTGAENLYVRLDDDDSSYYENNSGTYTHAAFPPATLPSSTSTPTGDLCADILVDHYGTTSALADIKTDIVEWSDIAASGSADLENKADPGNYDFTAAGSTGTPTYSGGVGITAADSFFEQTLLDDDYFRTNVDGAIAFRFRYVGGSVPAAGWAFKASNSTIGLRRVSSSTRFYMGGQNIEVTDDPVLNTWYVCVMQWEQDDATDGTLTVSMNDAAFGSPTTTSGTFGNGYGPFELDEDGTSVMEFDWFACWERLLTAAEVTALYNAGSTLEWADLP